MTNEELWQAVLAQIQLNISGANFSTWFKNTEIATQKGGRVVVLVPNSFAREWLANKYNKDIFKIIHDLDNGIKEVKYDIGKAKPRPEEPPKKEMVEIDQLNFGQLKINKETNLNPKYTFDSFVVGPFNELPHAAAIAVSKKPGAIYNPLFIYGGTGLGKTHLLQAIGNEILNNIKKKRVKYISSEKFTSEVVSAIKNRQMESFKDKYRGVDVLIIDDIQFLAGKEKTQEEFFHIFNVLHDNNKQVILSSDRPPKAINALAERLRSRFEGGMIADVGSPDLETRIAILKTKAQEKQIDFPDEIYQYIAASIQRNIRELEGALNRIVAHQKLNGKDIDINLTKALFKNLLNSPSKIVTPKKIIQAVVGFYDLKERDLLTTSRKKEIVLPRQIAMYLLREELKSSFPFIGRRFNGKDHTTAIHSYKKICRELELDKKLEEELELIKERIHNS